MFTGKVYPDYVSGTGYVIAGPLVPTLFETALHVPLFHLEDVFTTGMVARSANVTPENFHLFSYLKHPPDKAVSGCLYRKLITSHGLSPLELRQVWRRVDDHRLNCSSVVLPKIGDARTKKCRSSGKRVAVSSSIARHLARRGLLSN
jgi:beta-1,3-galactosyltransferase 1